jgi:flagellar motor switch protein FliN
MDDKVPDEEDEDLSSDFEFEDEDSEEFEEEVSEGAEEERREEESIAEEEEIPSLVAEEPPLPTRPPPPVAEKPKYVSPADIPVILKVELDRVNMTADRLLHLQPGNFLELHRTLEQGVDLVVNGEKIGRGELIRIGEAIGVRVTELG